MLRIVFLLSSCLLVLFIAGCGGSDTTIIKESNLEIPMRDGVILRGDVWRGSLKGRFPVIIYRTPYGKESEEDYNDRTFSNAVKRGYAVLIVDVRGRYSSDGEYTPYRNEGKDGYDTIEWAAVQEWSDGRIGTIGLSYPGAVQWLAGVENPPHLKAMAPAMSFPTMRHFIYFGGVFEIAWTGWIYKDMTPDARVRLGLPGPKTYDEAVAEWNRLGESAFVDVLPLTAMRQFDKVAPYYYEWISHYPENSWWDGGEVRDHYNNVSAAVLHLSGWHDEPYGPHGAVEGLAGILAARQGQADPRTRMIIGPWTHGAYETENPEAGDRKFPDNARINYDETVLDWMDRYVRDIQNGEENKPRVSVYIMGDNRWVEDSQFPLTGTEYKEIFLSKGSEAAPNHGGLTWIASSPQGSHTFVADPAKPVHDPYGTNFGGYDLSFLANQSDVLTFDSEMLTEDVTVVGPARAELFVSSTSPDYDLFVKLIDVAPEGAAWNLMSPGQEVLRASYRFNGNPRKNVVPGEVVKLDFNNLITGNTFKKGHRIRVNICASWHPIYSRNLQSGESEVYSANIRKASITIHHDPGHLSKLALPVLIRERNRPRF